MTGYWLDPKISWKTYKLLYDKTGGKDGGPTPIGFEKRLWEMLRERSINIYITDKEVHGDTWFPTCRAIPKKAILISTPTPHLSGNK